MKSRVMVIREEASDKKIKTLNLEDDRIFTNSWYYIKPNDIIVVPDDFVAKTKTEKRQNFQSTFAIIASSASLILILADRLFR